jgi:hypothetical protein
MDQGTRDGVAALAVFGQRQTIVDLLTGPWRLVPLKGDGKDGWNDGSINTYRRYWAGKKHYWYVDPWVLSDPDWDFHGTDPFSDQGWVRYRTVVDRPANYQDVEQELIGFMCGLIGVSDHLFFCDNPRWGWHAYGGVAQIYVRNHATTTFWSHPNGSYAYWSAAMIYDPNGCPMMDPVFELWPSEADALSVYDVSLVEHCIFDHIHLEARGASGVAATLDTTFLAMYNQAVQKGLDDETLEDGIELMQLSDIRGTFEKQQALNDIDGTTGIYMLQLKYTNSLGRVWYYVERGIQGSHTPAEPYYYWPPIHCGNILDFGFDTTWLDVPYDATGASYTVSAVDGAYFDDPLSYTIRFCNPQILMS